MKAARSYQEQTNEEVRRRWREGCRKPLVVSPTGSGKTFMGCLIVDGAIRKGRRVLWLAHRRELIKQASKSMLEIDVPNHGIILAGEERRPQEPIQIASVQTLAARPEDCPPADIVVVDEAHHAAAETWLDIMRVYPRAELILGLTATPERGDGKSLGKLKRADGTEVEAFDALISVVSIAELQRLGHLVPCTVVAAPKYQKGLYQTPLESVAKYGKRYDGKARQVVVFYGTVQEAQEGAEQFRRAGYTAACVDGKMPAEWRENALAKYAAGEIQILTNVMCLTEGWDAPLAELCIIARGCSSSSMWLQIIGRVLRTSAATGKRDCVVDDLRGAVHVHGLPEEERVYSLHGRGITRSAEARIPLAQCTACGACFKSGPPRCPLCGGAMPKPDNKAKVQRSEGRVATVDNITSRAEKRAYFDELVARARARNWNPKAIGVQFKIRFGHWPAWVPGRAA